MSAGPRTRIAPTPSGFLHAGNAWSFMLAWLCARSRGGFVALRIDDLDSDRLRPEYLEDIFASLAWLGLDWDAGPRDARDFQSHFSQSHRLADYRAALETLRADKVDEDGGRTEGSVASGSIAQRPRIYPCACSREQVRRDSAAAGMPGIYAGICREAGLDWARAAFPGRAAHAGESAGGDLPLRVRLPRNAEVTLPALAGPPLILHPGREMGDFVIWRKDGLPAYQLASVVDDEAMGIDCVVRGSDLRPSTGAQAWLAERLGATGFRNAVFLHHPLLLSAEGGKLSKSAGSDSLRALRARGGPGPLLRGFAAWLGMDPEGINSARDLIPGFSPERIPKQDRDWPAFAADLD
jgi:glutamyl-tRNA synthetase